MKRCPECDFIYEDDETLCAMDGTGLVDDSKPLPSLETALAQSTPSTNSYTRSLTLIAAIVILGLALFLVYRSVARRHLSQSAGQGLTKVYNDTQPTESPLVAAPVDTQTPLPSPSPSPETPPKTRTEKKYSARESDADPFVAAPIATATPFSKPSPSFSPASAKTEAPPVTSVFSGASRSVTHPDLRPPAIEEKTSKPSNTNQKNESKIKSLFKKTGRVLKKPFTP
jgi:hypothetical protein